MLGPMFLPAQKPAPPPTAQAYQSGLTVRAPRYVIDAEAHTTEFSGGVEATYGPTTLSADRLVFHDSPTDPYGEAIGNVVLVDPDGTVRAADLVFHWITRTGAAHGVSARTGSLTVVAESIDIKPGLWTLHNVGGTGCNLKTPLYYIRTPELQIRPNESIRAIRPQLSIFGRRIATFPTRTYSLTESSGSIDFPYPTFRSERGLGLNWSSELPLDGQTSAFTKYAVFQRSLPFYNATVMRSFLKDQDPEVLRTEIDDRFSFGYFDSVQVRSAEAEQTFIKRRRLELGLSSTFGADARDTTTPSDKINKPIEILGQASGNVRGWGVMGLARAQDVRVGDSPSKKRLLVEGNLLAPQVRLGSKLSLVSRIDAAEFTGGNRYGWIRGQAGLVFEASPHLSFGAALTGARDHGIPDFAYDVPLRSRELALRADLDFDTTQLRLLVKFDPATGGAFDHEVYVSQVVGCLEPYLVYRERPHKFFMGIKLPLSRVFARLSKDLSDRSAAVKHTISGPPQP